MRPLSPAASLHAPAIAALAGKLRVAVARFMAARRAVETRQALLEMDQRMLSDIGVTHAQAVEEARRAPWDLAPPRRGWLGR